MAQLTVLISSPDTEFRSYVTKLLRSSGVSVSLVDERHTGSNPPGLAVVDIRSGSSKALEGIERLRSSHPAAAIFVVASTAEPDQILKAMRAGANEYLSWSLHGLSGPPLEETFLTALDRIVERHQSKPGSRTSTVMSFFGAKGGAGTTTL